LSVYDTSGPYTDADVRIELSRGLPFLRREWIKQHDDTEILSGPTSEYARQRERDLLTYHLRFPSPFISRRARSGQNVSQMHYARKGIVTTEMELVALRESMLLQRLSQDPTFGRPASQSSHPRICSDGSSRYRNPNSLVRSRMRSRELSNVE
jgi:phosphomethylpyrimidine synthase